MPRIPRMSLPGVALHIVQRGNNRQAVFFGRADYRAYLDTLFESSSRYDVSVHAFVWLNPVRAGMTRHPGDYPWSSYGHNAVRLSEFPIRPHEAWLALGADASARRARYRALVKGGTNPDVARVIRYAARKGLPTGSDRFKRDIEAALARKIGDGRRGRPRKGL